jgi:hypothetical protein
MGWPWTPRGPWVADAASKRAVRVCKGGEILEEISAGDLDLIACAVGGEDGQTLLLCATSDFRLPPGEPPGHGRRTSSPAAWTFHMRDVPGSRRRLDTRESRYALARLEPTMRKGPAMLGRLAPWSHLRPTKVQVAADAAWEQAWVIPVGHRPSTIDFQRWTDAHGDNVDVEVFFAHEQAFVGVRLVALNAQARVAFLANTVSNLATGRWHVFAEVLADWWPAQAGEAFRPGQAVPDGVDLGVVNAWHTVGFCRVWRRGAPPLDRRRLVAMLERHPRLLQAHPQPVAVEVGLVRPWSIGSG